MGRQTGENFVKIQMMSYTKDPILTYTKGMLG